MSANQHSDETIAFFEANAERYARDTIDIGMEDLYGPFLALVPAGGHILDAGCGSGRDSLAFKRKGYQVTAIDASAQLARLASETIGHSVQVIRFQELEVEEEFDGIWACASLLHVSNADINEVFVRFIRAMRTSGAWYMSFKMDDTEVVRGGRFFSDYNEKTLGELLSRHTALETLTIWRTSDQRPDRRTECWVNAIVRKRNPPPARLSECNLAIGD
jgi:SAM-dependent methyltransferase